PLDSCDLSQSKSKYPARNLERGAKIISISSSESKVVVSLPRGNLEAFYPRMLLLDQVNDFITKKDFLSAFEILRKNRINLNYICDYNFELFIQNCRTFLEQFADKVDWVCLFLFELSSSNFCSIVNLEPEAPIEN